MRYIKIDLKRFSAFNELPNGEYKISVKAIGVGENTNSSISNGITIIKGEDENG